MSIYGELYPESHVNTFFKEKREQIFKVNIPNIGYPNHHTDIIFPTRLIDHMMIPNTLTTPMFMIPTSTSIYIRVDKSRSSS